jgi:rSAM/selenodomain-associated transferase 2
MISIVIPTYNEAGHIAATINAVHANKGSHSIEIIVADGNSTDATISIAQATGARVIQCKKGRAIQMNAGAAAARGAILYFLHADSFPPPFFTDAILNACEQGYCAGCFTLKFDYSHWFLNALCAFTKLKINAVRFGDQSLFATTQAFIAGGAFNESLLLMEDQEIISRLKKTGLFTCLAPSVTTSARKYLEHGMYKTQAVFIFLWSLYYLGFSQTTLYNYFQRFFSKKN